MAHTVFILRLATGIGQIQTIVNICQIQHGVKLVIGLIQGSGLIQDLFHIFAGLAQLAALLLKGLECLHIRAGIGHLGEGLFVPAQIRQLLQLTVPLLYQLIGQGLQLRAAGQKQDERQEQSHDLCLFHIGTPSNSQKTR